VAVDAALKVGADEWLRGRRWACLCHGGWKQCHCFPSSYHEDALRATGYRHGRPAEDVVGVHDDRAWQMRGIAAEGGRAATGRRCQDMRCVRGLGEPRGKDGALPFSLAR
jgi:hypothetical protein